MDARVRPARCLTSNHLHRDPARENSIPNESIWRQSQVPVEHLCVKPRLRGIAEPAVGRIVRQAAAIPWLSASARDAAESRDLVLCKRKGLCYTLPPREQVCRSFLGSSAVEHPTVNRMVAGSNPARGAK